MHGRVRLWRNGPGADPRNPGEQSPAEEIYFWTPGGQKLGTYTPTDTLCCSGAYSIAVTTKDTNIYFGKMMIVSRNNPLLRDRMGSTRISGTTPMTFYPFGEEQTSTSNDTDKYATYYRDATTGLDYGVNRYYNSLAGTYLTPDPSKSSERPGMPLSWNRYSYVLGDPINSRDPKGLEDADDDGDGSWDVDDSGDGGSGGGDASGADGDDNSVNYTTKDVTGTQADGTPIVGDPSATSGITVDGSQPSVSTDPSSTNALSNSPTQMGSILNTILTGWPLNGNLLPGFTKQDGVCTTGPLANYMNSNPAILSCCAAHDACYTQFKCNASSFISPIPGSCSACNAAVAACIGSVLIP